MIKIVCGYYFLGLSSSRSRFLNSNLDANTVIFAFFKTKDQQARPEGQVVFPLGRDEISRPQKGKCQPLPLNLGDFSEDSLDFIPYSLVNQECCLYVGHIVQPHLATCLFGFHPQTTSLANTYFPLDNCPHNASIPNVSGSNHSLSISQHTNLDNHQSMKT